MYAVSLSEQFVLLSLFSRVKLEACVCCNEGNFSFSHSVVVRIIWLSFNLTANVDVCGNVLAKYEF